MAGILGYGLAEAKCTTVHKGPCLEKEYYCCWVLNAAVLCTVSLESIWLLLVNLYRMCCGCAMYLVLDGKCCGMTDHLSWHSLEVYI